MMAACEIASVRVSASHRPHGNGRDRLHRPIGLTNAGRRHRDGVPVQPRVGEKSRDVVEAPVEKKSSKSLSSGLHLAKHTFRSISQALKEYRRLLALRYTFLHSGSCPLGTDA